MADREEDGRFKPGASPNPGGRPKQVRELMELARKAVPKAILRAAELLDYTAPAGRNAGKVTVGAAQVRLEACKFLRDTGMGKPKLATIEADPYEGMSDEQILEELAKTLEEQRKAREGRIQ